MTDASARTENQVGFFQIAILVLTILNLLALVADTVFVLPREISKLIQTADTAVCLVLLLDFVVRLYRSEDRRGFLKWGWIDLVAAIPMIDALRLGRLVRVLRVIRLLRGLRSVHRVVTLIRQNKMEAGGASLALTAFVVVAFSSSAILILERQSGGNIKTAEDALWWSISTITTVGYGDVVPITTEGRILAMIVMVVGIGLFAGLSGLMASLLLGRQDRKSAEAQEILARLEKLQAAVEDLNRSGAKPSGQDRSG